MPRLSAIIIAKNEAANIDGCLGSLAFCDELVVVDGGSTDDTVALAQGKGACVVSAPDWHGYGPQKNLALSQVTGDWVPSLDADERVPPVLAGEIQAAIAAGQYDGYRMPRTFVRTYFLRAEFLGGPEGYLVARYHAQTTFYRYMKAWMKQRQSGVQ